jgi:hypothetical protein
VVLRALEKDPQRRYQQVADLRADVEAIANERREPALAPAPTPTVLEATEVVGSHGGEATAAVPLEAIRRQVNGPTAGLTFAGVVSLLQLSFVGFLMDKNHVIGLTMVLLTALLSQSRKAIRARLPEGRLFSKRPRGRPWPGQNSSAATLP